MRGRRTLHRGALVSAPALRRPPWPGAASAPPLCGPAAAAPARFAYSFRDRFAPHFDGGINVASLQGFVKDKAQKERVEAHLALTSLPYTKKDLADEAFLADVRAGKTGC